MYNEGILTDKEHINEILSSGSDGNILVLGTKIYDLRSREISISCAELTDLIVRVNRWSSVTQVVLRTSRFKEENQ